MNTNLYHFRKQLYKGSRVTIPIFCIGLRVFWNLLWNWRNYTFLSFLGNSESFIIHLVLSTFVTSFILNFLLVGFLLSDKKKNNSRILVTIHVFITITYLIQIFRIRIYLQMPCFKYQIAYRQTNMCSLYNLPLTDCRANRLDIRKNMRAVRPGSCSL